VIEIFANPANDYRSGAMIVLDFDKIEPFLLLFDPRVILLESLWLGDTTKHSYWSSI
jgi:hypothetical protein